MDLDLIEVFGVIIRRFYFMQITENLSFSIQISKRMQENWRIHGLG